MSRSISRRAEQVLVGGEPDIERLNPHDVPAREERRRGESDRDRDLRDDHHGPDAAESQVRPASRGLAKLSSTRRPVTFSAGNTPTMAAPITVSPAA